MTRLVFLKFFCNHFLDHLQAGVLDGIGEEFIETFARWASASGREIDAGTTRNIGFGDRYAVSSAI